MMMMRVKVTRNCILGGMRHSSAYNPIALAIAEATHEVSLVGPRYMVIGDLQVDTPKWFLGWLEDFNSGVAVEPFMFRVPGGK
jgi:hypothetical protein